MVSADLTGEESALVYGLKWEPESVKTKALPLLKTLVYRMVSLSVEESFCSWALRSE